ncbi:hypothetical protein AGLY_014481 [Aphis glycines]|uniref:Uncharacterized protein n=1 Tax=Aphis glycines TaxID=307491 RepID=A0A6G0T592_APHGL|nr:hypothetical protein AGLY_014481 [Aphis glycines]
MELPMPFFSSLSSSYSPSSSSLLLPPSDEPERYIHMIFSIDRVQISLISDKHNKNVVLEEGVDNDNVILSSLLVVNCCTVCLIAGVTQSPPLLQLLLLPTAVLPYGVLMTMSFMATDELVYRHRFIFLPITIVALVENTSDKNHVNDEYNNYCYYSDSYHLISKRTTVHLSYSYQSYYLSVDNEARNVFSLYLHTNVLYITKLSWAASAPIRAQILYSYIIKFQSELTMRMFEEIFTAIKIILYSRFWSFRNGEFQMDVRESCEITLNMIFKT